MSSHSIGGGKTSCLGRDGLVDCALVDGERDISLAASSVVSRISSCLLNDDCPGLIVSRSNMTDDVMSDVTDPVGESWDFCTLMTP